MKTEKIEGKLYTDKEWLQEKYFGERLTMCQIGDLAGCSGVTVLRWMDRYGIKRRSKSEAGKLAWEDADKRREKLIDGIKSAAKRGVYRSPKFVNAISKKARKRWAAGKYDGENHPRWDSSAKLVTCGLCSKKVRRTSCRLEYNNHFCSKECYIAWMKRETEIVKCDWCGKKLHRIKFALDKNRNHFCSQKCQGQWNSENLVGENAPHWRGGISFEPYPPTFNTKFKQMIRERDEHTCVICRLPGKCVHHVNYIKDDTVPENCVTLCRNCHAVTNGNREYWHPRLLGLMEARGYCVQDVKET